MGFPLLAVEQLGAKVRTRPSSLQHRAAPRPKPPACAGSCTGQRAQGVTGRSGNVAGELHLGGEFLAVRDEACRQEPHHVLLPPTAPGAISSPTALLFALAELSSQQQAALWGRFSPRTSCQAPRGGGFAAPQLVSPPPPLLFSWGRSREVPLRAGESGRTGERLQEPRCTGRTSPGHSVPAAAIVRSRHQSTGQVLQGWGAGPS